MARINIPLFAGIEDNELDKMLACLEVKEQTYVKSEYILRAGEILNSIGLLMNGQVLIVLEDYWGNRNIQAKILPPGLFAESFACSPGTILNVSAIAETQCTVWWLDASRIMSTCPTACAYHSRVIYNLVTELSSKNLKLNEKLTHTSQRTTRDKVMSFLSAQSLKQSPLDKAGVCYFREPSCSDAKTQRNPDSQDSGRQKEFDIPFDRQQLADYLGVDRSALSAELSKLREQGWIDYRKNHFILYKGV